MNKLQMEDLMDSESFRHGMIAAMAQKVWSEGKWEPIFMDEELEKSGVS